jgi:aspartokinase/homoserine dehydrogenase 1
MTQSNWTIHKFGGTSVASAARYMGIFEIFKKELNQENGKKKGIVVSAMSGVTNSLIELIDSAKKRDSSYLLKLKALKDKHLQTIEELLPAPHQVDIKRIFENDFQDMADILRGIYLSRAASLSSIDLISGYGEIWSAQLLNTHLHSLGVNSQWLDARLVLIVNRTESGVSIDWKTSRLKLKSWLRANPQTYLIITGFIASTPDGVAATLGRNGSDFSATIFGDLFNASKITIWTDVDGVLSADPKLVPDAVVLDEMSYSEATELAYFGAKVVHPSTMAPAIEKQIPVWIRNTFNPSFLGTKIHKDPKPYNRVVKGFAAIDAIALVNIEGTGMIGVPGVAQRLFQALRDEGISVVMISQASSEHSICFAIQEKQAKDVKSIVEKAFFSEIHHGQIQEVLVTHHCSILAAVGDNMVQKPSVAGRFFGALGKAGISVMAIAQGSSERNISTVIKSSDTKRAIRVVHSSFYLSNQTLSIGIIGLGNIGSTFLNQLRREQARLKTDFRIDLRIRGLANSSRMLLEEEIDLDIWTDIDADISSDICKDTLQKNSAALDLEKFVSHVHTDYLPHTVIIDCTASSTLTSNYLTWLNAGIHLITPNKKANTGSLKSYRALKEAAKAKNRFFLYETNVGAGLPILRTLRDLINTGDKIERIEGIFSGTLSFIFNQFFQDKSFSEIVMMAKAKGYTEPNPKDDLSGSDVGRKLVILGREMGLPLELKQIPIEDLSRYDDKKMKAKLERAKKNHKVLRYVGVIDKNGHATVGLRTYSLDHPFAQLKGNDNIVAFKTARYNDQPLIIQGPGAGPEVTAGGVFADLLRLSSFLGAP